MNEKKAKALRKKVYGDMSLKGDRDYYLDPDKNSIVVTGLRKEYQKAKRHKNPK